MSPLKNPWLTPFDKNAVIPKMSSRKSIKGQPSQSQYVGEESPHRSLKSVSIKEKFQDTTPRRENQIIYNVYDPKNIKIQSLEEGAQDSQSSKGPSILNTENVEQSKVKLERASARMKSPDNTTQKSVSKTRMSYKAKGDGLNIEKMSRKQIYSRMFQKEVLEKFDRNSYKANNRLSSRNQTRKVGFESSPNHKLYKQQTFDNLKGYLNSEKNQKAANAKLSSRQTWKIDIKEAKADRVSFKTGTSPEAKKRVFTKSTTLPESEIVKESILKRLGTIDFSAYLEEEVNNQQAEISSKEKKKAKMRKLKSFHETGGHSKRIVHGISYRNSVR